jgi:hypothetical protein
MKKNLGNLDRVLRLLFGVIVAILYFTNILTGIIGLVLVIAGGILFATALIGFCPLYAILGLNSCPLKKVR